MKNVSWTGEEIFVHNGDFVFIAESKPNMEEGAVVLVAYFPDGEPFPVDYGNLRSASPEELEDVV